jgi:hypothetical protein
MSCTTSGMQPEAQLCKLLEKEPLVLTEKLVEKPPIPTDSHHFVDDLF